MQMLKEFRCSNCKRLFACTGGFTELQIKCSRCGMLNHVKPPSLEQSPLSNMKVESSATSHSTP
ncbi:Com family DNA-binding transcriptional regulator [Pseudomonas sp. WS 5532]|uniref:Com family DNA-binding transcriptional regulator n=2 Tax=Pseudomonas TaxID=286 RepID=UPI001475E709|nr:MULTISPECIES: Com family DNA-binding transcriptional regulator [Pseudomonas]NMX71849.1 Com family DNA-binding transcriptional regulator [Pseudomonas sp. WS 5532]